MKTAKFTLIWITVLVLCLAILGTLYYKSERDRHIRQMGEACIHHVHNMSASANPNLKDIYSFQGSDGVSNPELIKWQATLQCLQAYPLYYGQTHVQFNTTLN